MEVQRKPEHVRRPSQKTARAMREALLLSQYFDSIDELLKAQEDAEKAIKSS
ncbi:MULTISPECIES: hypothetical protein [Pseudomonas]|uniref:hypothetical protein n=1 Tax=Pseudomonas TaxID=286 RepID=UPI000AE0F1E1|nr:MULTISPECIES: hypothetical protein [Pseudomonas]NKF25849.1 hypothetical protein [Pseudomonas sp. BG5]